MLSLDPGNLLEHLCSQGLQGGCVLLVYPSDLLG
jgi:hypothetical protein